jgi:hypothetical protein
MGAEETAAAGLRGVGHGAAEAGLELLKVVFGWIVPLITLVIGLFIGASIGLSGLLADVLDSVLPAGVDAKTIALIADLIALAIWGVIAAALWHVGGGITKAMEGGPAKQNWTAYVVRPIATLFAGFAGSEAAALFRGNVNVGMISGIASKAAATAQGGLNK